MKTMTRFYLLFSLITLFQLQLQAQTSCGATAGQLSGSETLIPLGTNSPSPTFTVNPTGLPNTEFLVFNPDILADDELGGLLIGSDADGIINGNDYGLGSCEALCVIPFSYDLQQLKVLVHALYTEEFSPGVSCCAAASLAFGGICDTLSANGITDSSDVTGLNDLIQIVNAISSGTTYSPVGFGQTISFLGSAFGQIGDCSGGLTQLCFAMDSTGLGYQCFRMTNTATPATSVTASPASATLNTVGATQQYSASSLPANNTDSIVWWIEGGNAATINSSTGLLTAGNGSDTLMVIAYAPNSCVSDTVLAIINTPASIETLEQNFEIKWFQQPFNEQLSFSIEQAPFSGPTEIILYDLQGRILLQKVIQLQAPQLIELNTSSLAEGIYYFQLRHAKGQFGKALMKK
jgi:hypothetical protein